MRKGFIYAIVATLAFLVVAAFIWPVVNVNPPPHPNSRVISELQALVVASHAYRLEYGHFPMGSALDICRALSGNNPRSIRFIDLQNDSISESGAFLDPWGTPYRMSYASGTTATASTAGKDRTFGTDDDATRTK